MRCVVDVDRSRDRNETRSEQLGQSVDDRDVKRHQRQVQVRWQCLPGKDEK